MEHKCSAIRTLVNFKTFMEILIIPGLDIFTRISFLVQEDFKIDASLGSLKYWWKVLKLCLILTWMVCAAEQKSCWNCWQSVSG